MAKVPQFIRCTVGKHFSAPTMPMALCWVLWTQMKKAWENDKKGKEGNASPQETDSADCDGCRQTTSQLSAAAGTVRKKHLLLHWPFVEEVAQERDGWRCSRHRGTGHWARESR